MKDLSTRFVRLSIGLSFYSFALVGLSVGVGGVILKSLSTSYHVGDAVLGTLFVVFYLSYSLSSFFCGPLAQRLSLRWLLVVGTTLFLLGMVGFILEVPFALLEISYVCMGLGTGMIETGFNIFISALPGRTSLLNYLHAFYGVGIIFGPLLATGILALLWGWNRIYVVLAVLILLQLVGIGLTLGRFLIQPMAQRKGVSVTTLMYTLIGAAILSLLITWLMPFGILAGIGFCLLGLSLAPIYPLTVALVPKLVPERLVPSANRNALRQSFGVTYYLPHVSLLS